MKKGTRIVLALLLLPALLTGCIIDPYWGEGYHHHHRDWYGDRR